MVRLLSSYLVRTHFADEPVATSAVDDVDSVEEELDDDAPSLYTYICIGAQTRYFISNSGVV